MDMVLRGAVCVDVEVMLADALEDASEELELAGAEDEVDEGVVDDSVEELEGGSAELEEEGGGGATYVEEGSCSVEVVVGATQVEVGWGGGVYSGVGVGAGSGVELEAGGASAWRLAGLPPPPPPYDQLILKRPTSVEAKNLKRLSDMSRSPEEQPGQRSTMVAWVVLPPYEMVTCCPQCAPPSHIGWLRATIKSEPELFESV